MSVTFDRLPESAAEISALADGALGNPEHTCTLFLGALKRSISCAAPAC